MSWSIVPQQQAGTTEALEIHESVRRDVYRRMGKEGPKDTSDDDQDNCMNGIVGQVLKDQNEFGELDEQHIHKEGWAERSDNSSEKSGNRKHREGGVLEGGDVENDDPNARPRKKTKD